MRWEADTCSITKLFGVLLLFLNVRPQQGDDVEKTKAGILEFRSLGLDIVQEGIDLRLKGQELLANSGTTQSVSN